MSQATPAELAEQLAQQKLLLDIYRVLRSTSGLRGRPWSPHLHHRAEDLLDEHEEKLLPLDDCAVTLTLIIRPLDEA